MGWTHERGICSSRLIECDSFRRKRLDREQERRRWRLKEVAEVANLADFPEIDGDRFMYFGEEEEKESRNKALS